MPNINLIGEDEEEEKKQPEVPQEESATQPQESGSSFADETFSLDTREFAPEKEPQKPQFTEKEPPKVTTPPPDLTSYTRPRRGSRATGFLVGGFLVVALAVILFWKLQKKEGTVATPGETPPSQQVEARAGGQAGETKPVTEQPGQQAQAEQPARTAASTPPAVPQGVPSYASEAAEITAAAVGMLQVLPEDVNFTLLSFTGGRFLIEYVAPTRTAALAFPDMISNSLPVEQTRILTQEQVTADGQSLQKVLLQGSVALGSLAAPEKPVQYLDIAGLRRAVARLARSSGLRLRSVETRQGLVDDGFELIPIDFRFSGKKANAASFLGALGQAGLNLRLGKLVLVSTDRRGLSDEEVNLALNANLFRPR